MSDSVSFALLCPVPDEHLESGISVAADTGYVCFGSNAWEVFKELDAMRGTEDVPVLFYPSYEDLDAKSSFKVTYIGWYVGHVTTDSDKMADDKARHRPKTVDPYRGDFDNPHHWALFWRIKELSKLPDVDHVSIGTLQSYKTGKPRLNRPPRGPSIIARPAWFK